ncbi:MAG TPA: cold shock domain-containing protein [Dehalococcoidia bacterium]|nr:cold shock domain-containing protein [Dehalococcoidia bacterium]
MAVGQIKTLVRDRGFGFIQKEGSSEDIFFHTSAVAQGAFDDLKEGQTVEFDEGQDPRGSKRMRAENVRVTR